MRHETHTWAWAGVTWVHKSWVESQVCYLTETGRWLFPDGGEIISLRPIKGIPETLFILLFLFVFFFWLLCCFPSRFRLFFCFLYFLLFLLTSLSSDTAFVLCLCSYFSTNTRKLIRRFTEHCTIIIISSQAVQPRWYNCCSEFSLTELLELFWMKDWTGTCPWWHHGGKLPSSSTCSSLFSTSVWRQCSYTCSWALQLWMWWEWNMSNAL